MNKLSEYAIQYYQYCQDYLRMVLNDFPEDKMTETIGKAKSPAELLFHAVATPHWWMKRADRGFDFKAKFVSIPEAIELWGRQLDVFKKILDDDAEGVWTPTTSVPWIMIRTSNHLVHHLGMIIYARNYYGLPPLQPLENGFNWGTLVDWAGKFHYSQ